MSIAHMNRRAALRRLLYVAGGALLLPACYRKSGEPTVELTNLLIDEKDENLLAELVDTIIPPSDTPGGKELLLHLFVLKMVDDCHSPDDQTIFMAGLRSFSNFSRGIAGNDFVKLDTDKRIALLEAIGGEATEEQIKRFYAITKRRTIQGYLNSQYVMTHLIKYELVPGRYDGYAKIV